LTLAEVHEFRSTKSQLPQHHPSDANAHMEQQNNTRVSKGRLIIARGLPGSGKTTLAKQLEAELHAIPLCPDEWMNALSIDLYDAKKRAQIEARQWEAAKSC
jgi:uridine kinase